MASSREVEGKNGTAYKITVPMGRDAQDKQIRHFKTWKPERPMTARQMEKEVQRVAYEFEKEIEQGFQADNRQTFEYAWKHLQAVRVCWGDQQPTECGTVEAVELCAGRGVSGRIVGVVARDKALEDVLNKLLDGE